MRKMLVSAAVGVAFAVIVSSLISIWLDIIQASRFTTIQQEEPETWLLIEDLRATDTVEPNQPTIRLVGTPSRDLLIRTSVSARNVETGEVRCSGSGATVLYVGGVAVAVASPLSRLAGLESCEFPEGRYRVRITFRMTEPDSQVTKTLLVETEDINVTSASEERSHSLASL